MKQKFEETNIYVLELGKIMLDKMKRKGDRDVKSKKNNTAYED